MAQISHLCNYFFYSINIHVIHQCKRGEWYIASLGINGWGLYYHIVFQNFSGTKYSDQGMRKLHRYEWQGLYPSSYKQELTSICRREKGCKGAMNHPALCLYHIILWVNNNVKFDNMHILIQLENYSSAFYLVWWATLNQSRLILCPNEYIRFYLNNQEYGLSHWHTCIKIMWTVKTRNTQ